MTAIARSWLNGSPTCSAFKKLIMDNLTEALCKSEYVNSKIFAAVTLWFHNFLGGSQGTEPWAGEVSSPKEQVYTVPRDGVMCARVGLLGWTHLLGLSELSVGFTDAGGMECLTDFSRGVLLGRWMSSVKKNPWTSFIPSTNIYVFQCLL